MWRVAHDWTCINERRVWLNKLGFPTSCIRLAKVNFAEVQRNHKVGWRGLSSCRECVKITTTQVVRSLNFEENCICIYLFPMKEKQLVKGPRAPIRAWLRANLSIVPWSAHDVTWGLELLLCFPLGPHVTPLPKSTSISTYLQLCHFMAENDRRQKGVSRAKKANPRLKIDISNPFIYLFLI